MSVPRWSASLSLISWDLRCSKTSRWVSKILKESSAEWLKLIIKCKTNRSWWNSRSFSCLGSRKVQRNAWRMAAETRFWSLHELSEVYGTRSTCRLSSNRSTLIVEIVESSAGSFEDVDSAESAIVRFHWNCNAAANLLLSRCRWIYSLHEVEWKMSLLQRWGKKSCIQNSLIPDEQSKTRTIFPDCVNNLKSSLIRR